jgi:propanol-preferring alcohol dehydrogenase
VGGSEQLCATPTWVGLSQYDGGYADYMLVPHERYLVKLDKLTPRVAAPLTDAALTPYHAVKKAQSLLDADKTALVIGLGGLGQYGLKLLRLLTGCSVIAVDTSEDKRRVAKELGATHVLDGKDPKLAEKVLDLSGGVAASFDFVGSESTLALAIGTTRTLGKVSQVGLAGGTAHLKVLQNSRFEVSFECTLWGTIRELREVISLAERGILEPNDIEVFPHDKINDVYARLKKGDIRGRAVIA